jgi:hypothetical protein
MHAVLADLDSPVRNIDEGVEILTGKEAGSTQIDATYHRQETINFLVDRK